jgi:hypothetical protein
MKWFDYCSVSLANRATAPSVQRPRITTTTKGSIMNQNISVRTGLALAMTLVFCVPVLAQNADQPMPKAMKMDHAKMNHHKMMMDQCKGMMDEMKSQDADLADQITKMNNASKDDKVDLMAAILTQMSMQRAAMNEKMGNMYKEMMGNMHMGKTSAAAPAKK